MSKLNPILDLLSKVNPAANFTSSVDFIGDYLLDSLDIMTLTVALEEKYHFRISAADITLENYRNLEAISDLVRKCGGEI